MSIKKKIFIFGIGYVGASLAYLLAKNNKVICFDIDKNKIDKIKNNEPPIPDKNLVNYIEESNLDITGLSSLPEHLNDQDFIIICTPTNFDENKNAFDTESITKIVKNLSLKTHFANIIIKSTVPIGFTRELQKKYKQFNILHSPEFLREGNALYDNQFPSRIVVGHIDSEDIALFFAKLLESLSKVNDVPIIIVSSD
jgi:UDPglucose 6-dehydrogenase